MQYVWMILSLIIGVGVAYLIWDEYIVKRERPQDESSADRYVEADIKAFADETRPVGEASDAEIATALHSAVETAEEELAAAETEASDTLEEVAETAAALEDEAEGAVEELVAEAEDAVTASAEDVTELAATRAAEVDIDVTPDDLTKIKGIGKVYQQRLNEAGIYSFAQLAEMEPDALAEATNAIDAANLDEWKRQARELMA